MLITKSSIAAAKPKKAPRLVLRRLGLHHRRPSYVAENEVSTIKNHHQMLGREEQWR